MDDILIVGWDREYYDYIFEVVIKRVMEFNLCFNFDKCRVCKMLVFYIGYIISFKGISLDFEKIKVVCNMLVFMNRDVVWRFLGLV